MKNKDPFYHQMMCEFGPDPLYKYAKKYHDQTESYDRQICSFRDEKGIAMPKDSYERRLINKNAKEVFEELYLEVAALGKTRQEFQKSISDLHF